MMNDQWQMSGPNVHIQIKGDLVVIQVIGEVALEDVEQIFEAYGRVRQEHEVLLALYDARLGKGMTPDARKAIMTAATPQRRADVTVVFGAPFPIRALVNMLDRAFTFLNKKSLEAVMFATESEAREYLDQQRIRLRSKQQ